MDEPIRGSCLCGGVRFEVTQPLSRVAHCHCSRCRKHSGAGALVMGRVPANSPAGKAGVQEGDVILALNGQPIDVENQFIEVLFQFNPGDTVQATVQRGAEQLEVSVTLAERKTE